MKVTNYYHSYLFSHKDIFIDFVTHIITLKISDTVYFPSVHSQHSMHAFFVYIAAMFSLDWRNVVP